MGTCGRIHQMASGCRKICASSSKRSSEQRCINCDAVIFGCRVCAQEKKKDGSYRYEQWVYKGIHSHLNACNEKGNMPRPFGNNRGKDGQFSASKSSKWVKASCISKPRCYSTAKFNGIKNLQYVRGFLPHTHLGNQFAITKLTSSYSSENGTPMKLSEHQFREKVDSNFSEDSVDRICNLKNVGIKAKGIRPYHLWVNPRGESEQWVPLHTDKCALLFIQLRGWKVIYVGSEPPDDKRELIDGAQRIWGKVDNPSSFSEMWKLEVGENPNASTKELTKIANDARCFQRFQLAPGDALVLPRRYLHVVLTSADSMMASIAIDLDTN